MTQVAGPAPEPAGRTAARFDSLILAELAKTGADLTKPIGVVNFLYFATADAARDAAAELEPEGYEVIVQRAVMGAKWLTQAHATMVPSAENVASQRTRFEALASTHGGEYSGWEAALTTEPGVSR